MSIFSLSRITDPDYVRMGLWGHHLLVLLQRVACLLNTASNGHNTVYLVHPACDDAFGHHLHHPKLVSRLLPYQTPPPRTLYYTWRPLLMMLLTVSYVRLASRSSEIKD